MADGVEHEADVSQLARLVQSALLQAQQLVVAMLPERLADLADHLEEIHPTNEPERVANFSLFHQVLFYRVSSILYRSTSPTMSELSRALSVPLSTATRMVGWMVDMRYAERLPDQHDRRIVRVSLTDSGRQLYEAVESFITQRLEQIAALLTTEERSALLVGLGKMMSALEDGAR